MVDVEVRSATLGEKGVVARLLELYLHDLSVLTGADVGSDGRYGYRYLDDYWSEPDCFPFLLRVDGHLAGLALVQSGSPHDMAEFFVMRRYRRRGVGRRAARALFNLFPGEWQIRQLAANRAATTFWRAVIPVPFRDSEIEIGPVQHFRVDPGEPRGSGEVHGDGPIALGAGRPFRQHGRHEHSARVMTTELEAKLIPTEGFRIPPLDGMPAGSVTVADPVRELDATYYDTPDLELARWGITLRHRRGESGPPWTLKLPEHASRTALAREELTFEGGTDAVPTEASDLVRGFTRDNPLNSVARLHTTRVPLHVRDADGRTLIEIVDDSVEISEGVREIDHFREVEVEATINTARSRAALRAAVATLLGAGCRVEPPIPKLVRALGQPAQRPPSVVAVPVDKHASPTDLIRHLTASSVIQILMHDPGVRLGHDPEAVHLYRVATRRLRADFRTFSRLLDDVPTNELRDELRWLGQAAGPVRDLDVLGARFEAHARDLSDVDHAAASTLLTRLAAARFDAHQRLLAALRSDRYDRTLRMLVAFAAEPPVAVPAGDNPAKPAAAVGLRLVKKRFKQLAEAVEAAGDVPTDAELHQIRIAAKRCRYAAEAIAPVIGRPARRFAAAVAEVQTVLGDYHDTVVAEAWLRDAAVELIDCRVAIGGLIAAERRERATFLRAWPAAWRDASKPKARAWLSGAD